MPRELVARDYDVPKRPIFMLDGWDVVQGGELAAYVSSNITENVMFSTNGTLGLHHRSELETIGFRTPVMMNGVYHTIPLESNISSEALPSVGHTGALLCEMELNCFIDGESGTLTGIPQRRMSMRDGVYYSTCTDVMSSDGAVTFDAHYRRVASLSDLDTWGADVVYTNFQLRTPSREPSEDIGEWPGPQSCDSQERHLSSFDQGSNSHSRRYDVVFEVSVIVDSLQWQLIRGETMDDFCIESRSSGQYVNTLTAASCVVNYGANSTRIPPEADFFTSLGSPVPPGAPQGRQSDTDSDDFSGVPPGPSYSAHANVSDLSPTGITLERGLRGIGGGYPTSNNGAATSTFGGYSTGGANAASSTNSNYGTRPQAPRAFVMKKRFRYSLHCDSIPQSVALCLVTRHSQGENCVPRPLVTMADIIASQVVIIDSFWNDIVIDLQLQDEVHPNRTRLSLLFNVFRLFCVSGSLRRGLPRAGCSASGSGMLCDLRTYIAHGLFYTFIRPQSALELLKGLWLMLPQARKNAAMMALPRGALFPQSTINGTECRQYLTVNNARFYPNSDIGYLVNTYFNAVEEIAPQDRLILLELTLEAARVWPQLGEWLEGGTLFRLDNIAGPDEYNTSVSGNFYIHLSAKKHMENVVSTFDRQATILGDAAVTQLLESIQMSRDEIANLKRTSEGIAVRRNDHKGVYFQHDYFDTLRSWRGERVKHPMYVNYHPLAIYRHKVVEIPEVLLGMMLYNNEFEKKDLDKNLAYYEPLCTHDAPESLAVVAIMQLRTKRNFAKTVPLLRALVHLDLDNITYAAEEGLHFGAMSCSWVTIAIGMGGLRIRNGVLHLDPCLPPGVRSVTFSLQWRGAVLKTSISAEWIKYEIIRGDSLRFVHAGECRIHLHVAHRFCTARTSIQVPRLLNYKSSDFDGVVIYAECMFANMMQYNYLSWRKTLETLFESYRVLHQREIPPLSEDEYIDKVIFQAEQRELAFSGIRNVLLSRGIDLELGAADDAEIVETRYGLANYKVAELAEVIQREQPKVDTPFVHLLRDFARQHIPVVIVSYSRSLQELLACNPEVSPYFTASIDGEEVHDRRIKGRPHTELWVRAAERIYVDPSRCVVLASHLGRGYKAEDLAQFRMFFDVEDDFVKRPLGPYPTQPCTSRTRLDEFATADERTATTEGRSLVIPLLRSQLPISMSQLEAMLLKNQMS